MAEAISESRTQALLFAALAPDGSNFLEWDNDMMTYLMAEELADALYAASGLAMPVSHRYQALVIIRRHLHPTLRKQYLQVDTPWVLWAQLQERFNYDQQLFLPQARMEWSNLRVLDFPDLQSFNTELHRITSQLRLCGEIVTDAELIDKTLSTFPPATAILAQQYRNMHFPRHAELMSYLFVAERQQQMLLKNAESRPAREVHVTESPPSVPPKSGSVPTPTPAPPAPTITPEVNSTEAAKRNPTSGRGRGRGRGRGGNSGRGGYSHYGGRSDRYSDSRDRDYDNDRRYYNDHRPYHRPSNSRRHSPTR